MKMQLVLFSFGTKIPTALNSRKYYGIIKEKPPMYGFKAFL